MERQTLKVQFRWQATINKTKNQIQRLLNKLLSLERKIEF